MLWLILCFGLFCVSYLDIDVCVLVMSEIEDFKCKCLYLVVCYVGLYMLIDDMDVLFCECVVVVCSLSLLMVMGDVVLMKLVDFDKYVLLYFDDLCGEWLWYGWSYLLKEFGVLWLWLVGVLYFS